jgi:hypothetical protein
VQNLVERRPMSGVVSFIFVRVRRVPERLLAVLS